MNRHRTCGINFFLVLFQDKLDIVKILIAYYLSEALTKPKFFK